MEMSGKKEEAREKLDSRKCVCKNKQRFGGKCQFRVPAWRRRHKNALSAKDWRKAVEYWQKWLVGEKENTTEDRERDEESQRREYIARSRGQLRGDNWKNQPRVSVTLKKGNGTFWRNDL